MPAIATKHPKKFNILKIVEEPTYSCPGETVIEWGELAGFMYFVMRRELDGNRVSIEIATGQDMAVYALLRPQGNCLVIEEIDFHYRLLKAAFARRIIWLIIAEAINAELKEIDGYVPAESDLRCLVNAFNRYGFTCTYDNHNGTSDDNNMRFQIQLGEYDLPFA